ALGNVGVVAFTRAFAAERPFRHQNLRRDFVGTDQPKPVLFEDPRNTGQEMIIAAAINRENARQQPERFQIGLDLPNRRSGQRADKNNVAAPLPAGNPAEPAEPAQRCPMMRVAENALRVGPTANCKQHHAAPAPGHGISHGERQTAAAANDGKRALLAHRCCDRLAHNSSSTSARRTAMVNDCEPERMKAITLPTSASSPWLAATASTRSRKVPVPKNIAS